MAQQCLHKAIFLPSLSLSISSLNCLKFRQLSKHALSILCFTYCSFLGEILKYLRIFFCNLFYQPPKYIWMQASIKIASLLLHVAQAEKITKMYCSLILTLKVHFYSPHKLIFGCIFSTVQYRWLRFHSLMPWHVAEGLLPQKFSGYAQDLTNHYFWGISIITFF